ncbi:MAG: DUF6263 family protein, partial [Actinomycetota bacterium]|nr:DUF6263 family protein [Actinomycetota bacterium]
MPGRRVRLGALAITATFAFAACGDDEGGGDTTDPTGTSGTDTTGSEGGDADQTPDDDIALLAGGQQQKYRLAPVYEEGQEATNTMDLTVSVSGAGQNISIGMQLVLDQVVASRSEGASTVESMIREIEVVDAPDGAEETMRQKFEGVLGKTLVTEYDENGQQVGETTLKDGGELPDSMRESVNANSQAVFPTEEIGIGSRWSQVLTSESEGFDFDITTVYELKEVTDDEFVIAMSQDVPIDESVDGEDVSGDFTGTGEVRVSRTNPLLLTSDYTSDMSVTADGDDIELAIDL